MSRRGNGGETPAVPETIAAYKAILREILDRRPSGTRQRLATALGKNRSFISQITNPAYGTPVPARHLEVIFDVCHFTSEERRQFLEAFDHAHPRRLSLGKHPRRVRPITVYLPDFDSEQRNRELDRLVSDFVQRLTRFVGGG